MQCDERIADDGRHMINRAGVRPIRVMNRGKGQALCLTTNGKHATLRSRQKREIVPDIPKP